MSLVVDTSVVISVLTNEKSKSKLVKITQNEDLIAPSSLHWEIGNAFSAMFKRNRIDLITAEKATEYYKLIPMRLVEVDIYKSLELSYRHNIYTYDAYFLECARKHNSRFLTLDKGLRDIAEKMKINVVGV